MQRYVAQATVPERHMARVTFDDLRSVIEAAFLRAGLPADGAATCARIHAETTADGVNSHGLNRVPRFVEYVGRGWVDVTATPSLARQLGAIQVYDGNRAAGILNALFATERAMALAAEQGMGLVALRNTNHWMRGGTYGWKAAAAGFIAIAWTNTESCMPAWGGKNPRLGNNPFVMAAPRSKGPVVLDMAMSQYSYGKLQTTRLKGERLPTAGGYDSNGQLTDEPGPIEQSQRILPTGFWKGSGFAILLDVLAAVLSEGLPTNGIDALHAGSCVGCSQIFLVIDPRKFGGSAMADAVASSVVDYVHASTLAEGCRDLDYPGEGALRRRERQMRDGIDVDDSVWAEVRSLAGLV